MALHLVTGYAGSPHITAADAGAFNAGVFGKGDYVLSTGEGLAARVITNNSIRIASGDIVMQGRHISLKAGTYEDITINNGTQGMSRNDIIVARYEKNTSTGMESATFAVLRGTNVSGTPSDPEHTIGNILAGDTVHEMPLYRVTLNGLNIESVTQLFTFAGMPVYVNTMDDLKVLHDASNIGQIQFIDFSLDFCDVIFDIPFSQGQGYAKKMSEQYTDVFMFSGIKNLVTFRYDADARKIYSSNMITLSDDCVTIAPVDELPSDAAKNPKTLYVITE